VKLPRSESAIVDRLKLVDYLLNPAHPDNGGKARFFQSLGYTPENWEQLATALRDLARTADVDEEVASPFGTKYIIEAELPSLTARSAAVVTVWICEDPLRLPRLVTAYPGARS
jgi:hypothetical protein